MTQWHSAETLVDLMFETLTNVGPVGLTLEEGCMLADLTPNQFRRGLRLTRRAGVDIAEKEGRYCFAFEYDGGEEYTVKRLRDSDSRLTTMEGFLTGLLARHPEHADRIHLAMATIAAARLQVSALADLLTPKVEVDVPVE